MTDDDTAPATEPAPATDSTTEPASAAEIPSTDGHPVLIYTLLRFLLLLAVGGVLYLFGVRGVWLILFAFLVSGFVSIVALNRRREVAAVGFTSVIKRVNDRIDASTRAEDVDVEDDLAQYETTDSAPATPATDEDDEPQSGTASR